MSVRHAINYIEIPVKDVALSKAFFANACGWEFIDYGPDYAAISNAGIDGGLYKADTVATVNNGSVLVVLYSDNLEASEAHIIKCGGEIVNAIFSFPGGRRFHFKDPNGNEYAIWSDK